MKEELLAKSERKNIADLFGILFYSLGIMIIAVFIIKESLSDIYPFIALLGLGVFIALMSLGCLLVFMRFYNIEIYSDRLVIKSLLGYIKKTVFLGEIKNWSEGEIKRRYSKSTKLTLYAETTKFTFSSLTFSNYEALRGVLIKGKPQIADNSLALAIRNVRINILGTLLLGLISICFGFIISQNKQKPFIAVDFKKITDVITNRPMLQVHDSSHYIWLDLKNYPEFNFLIYSDVISLADARTFVSKTSIGDSISIDILTNDYLKKLTHQLPLSFDDKTDHYRRIDICSLTANDQEYASLSNYIASHVGKTPDSAKLLWIVGVFFISGSVFVRIFLQPSSL